MAFKKAVAIVVSKMMRLLGPIIWMIEDEE